MTALQALAAPTQLTACHSLLKAVFGFVVGAAFMEKVSEDRPGLSTTNSGKREFEQL
jgi:hypothetical protein